MQKATDIPIQAKESTVVAEKKKTSLTTQAPTPVLAPAPHTPAAWQSPTLAGKAAVNQAGSSPVSGTVVAPETNLSQLFSHNSSGSRSGETTKIKKGVVKNNGTRVSHRTGTLNGFGRSSRANSVDLAGKKTKQICGILDTFKDNLAIIRKNYAEDEDDTFIPINVVRKYKLQPGDVICGEAREPKENDRYWGLLSITSVNDVPLEEYLKQTRVKFHQLTPVYPDEQIKLETGGEPFSTRIVDMIAPIGKGQRSLIVSPPKAGKTSFLKEISTGIAANYPDIHLMAVLIGERPEEVTDMRRHIEKITHGTGEVAASNFDEAADAQCRVAELALERAKRLVEKGRDVVILLDSITRLARAYNLSIPTSGRTLSGGFDPAALFPPKRFFGAARNFEVAGSLTIIGTALVDTGSRMDDLVYEEFKGTGNQELHLDRRLAERRIYPAIDVQKSGTRRDDLLIDSLTYQAVLTLERMLDTLNKDERTTTLLEQMKKTKSNKEFLQSLRHA